MVVGMAEAGQSCGEPLHREEEEHPHQDVFGRDLTHGDQPLADGTMVLVIKTPPGQAGRFLEHVVACWACFACVIGCRSPREANVLLIRC
jgi:hypothetical protein